MTANHPLRAWRVSHGLTVVQVACLIKASPAAVRNYELARRVPRPAIMARIEMVTLRRVRASDFLPDLRGSFLSGPLNAPEPAITQGANSAGDGEHDLAIPGHHSPTRILSDNRIGMKPQQIDLEGHIGARR